MEIKFRVWDNAPVNDGLNGIMVNHEYAMQSGYLIDALNGKYPLMQFIKKLDYNDKEIYQSDIVKCTHNEGLSWVKPKVDIGEVVYSDQCMFVIKCLNPQTRNAKDVKKRYFYISFKPDRKFEVIGNIYENPELLQS